MALRDLEIRFSMHLYRLRVPQVNPQVHNPVRGPAGMGKSLSKHDMLETPHARL